MKHLADELLRRFPEVAAFMGPGDEDLPYLVVGYIARWLKTVAKPSIAPQIVKRVVEFDRWCFEQPRGKSAEDDIATIAMVALREELFGDDRLLPLVPKLMMRDELLQNKAYFVAWVGQDRYDAALKLRWFQGDAGSRRGRKRKRK